MGHLSSLTDNTEDIYNNGYFFLFFFFLYSCLPRNLYEYRQAAFKSFPKVFRPQDTFTRKYHFEYPIFLLFSISLPDVDLSSAPLTSYFLYLLSISDIFTLPSIHCFRIHLHKLLSYTTHNFSLSIWVLVYVVSVKISEHSFLITFFQKCRLPISLSK